MKGNILTFLRLLTMVLLALNVTFLTQFVSEWGFNTPLTVKQLVIFMCFTVGITVCVIVNLWTERYVK